MQRAVRYTAIPAHLALAADCHLTKIVVLEIALNVAIPSSLFVDFADRCRRGFRWHFAIARCSTIGA